MKRLLVTGLVVLATLAAGLVSGSDPALAVDHSSCMYCHTPHNAVGNYLTRVQGVDALCESCHATGTNAAPDALTHVWPNSSNPYWDFGCHTCHTNHSGVKNRDYKDSATVLNASRTGTSTYTATLTLSKDLGLQVGNWIWVDRVISNVPVANPGLVGYNGGWQVTAVNPANKTVSYQISSGDPNTYISGGIAAVGHAHTGGGAGGGVNIKLVGRDEDGSGIARIQTPLTLLSAVYNNVTPPSPCTTGNVAVQVALPLFRQGFGPPHTVMVDDRVTLLNVNPSAWDGSYTVTQTFKGANKARFCLTRTFSTAPGTYASTDLAGRSISSTLTNGWLFSAGWATRKTITGATHSNGDITLTIGSDVSGIKPLSAQSTVTAASSARVSGQWTATLTLTQGLGIAVGDAVVVKGVSVPGYNGTYKTTAVSGLNISYAIAASLAGASGGTTTTADGDLVSVFGIVSSGPGTFNGKWEVKAVNTGAQTITVRCPPAHDSTVAPSSACALIAAGGGYNDPGTYTSGGSLQSTGTMRRVIFESRGTDIGYTAMNSFADVDTDADAVMDGPCELCHLPVVAHHVNDDFTDSHHVGNSCSESCHPHGQGFDKASNPGGLDSPCPAVGCRPPAQPYP
jgi:predicted CXXCH cytochrome family protein